MIQKKLTGRLVGSPEGDWVLKKNLLLFCTLPNAFFKNFICKIKVTWTQV